MSSGRAAAGARSRARASARLGSTLRSICFTPKDGFAAALTLLDRRRRAKQRPAEGLAPFVLSALGGAALAMLWLKLGSLLDLRHVTPRDFRWVYVAGALVAGAGLGVIVQLLWGWLGSRVLRRLGSAASPAELRMVWGASAFPQLPALVVLLPLDIAIVGQGAFTTRPVSDSLSVTWIAVSIAITIALALWSIVLFVRGIEVVSRIDIARALVGVAIAVACFAVVVAGLSAAVLVIAGSAA